MIQLGTPSFAKSRMLIGLIAFCLSCFGSQVILAQTPDSAFDKDPWPASKDGPVKVFILAGQSNMQGHASLRTLEYLIYNSETAQEYQHWKDKDGLWTQRNDVWVWTTDGPRFGSLKPGFGAREFKIGPELGFGWVVGEAFDEQILLIKTCWGGRSVRRDFLSPSSPQPDAEQLQADLERMRRRTPTATLEDVQQSYGKDYRLMLEHVSDVLANADELFPGAGRPREYQLSGFVWFQGWNDMVDREQREEKYQQYTTRLTTMIEDLRKDLSAPNLPVVIGELGANGNRGDFQAAQQAAAEALDNAVFVPTVEFWDSETAELAEREVWKTSDWSEYYNVGSDRGYHYLGSAKILTKIGQALGTEMVELIKQTPQPSE
ncbi:sialate O-acetylesterase [Thalassoglobus sp. JC818]|uniref:sialate O-acetylesterase n=1 Tax=Thalassoglobus sp. JC818 TaxID=3232136 RepID=UPI0034596B5A